MGVVQKLKLVKKLVKGYTLVKGAALSGFTAVVLSLFKNTPNTAIRRYPANAAADKVFNFAAGACGAFGDSVSKSNPFFALGAGITPLLFDLLSNGILTEGNENVLDELRAMEVEEYLKNAPRNCRTIFTMDGGGYEQCD